MRGRGKIDGGKGPSSFKFVTALDETFSVCGVSITVAPPSYGAVEPEIELDPGCLDHPTRAKGQKCRLSTFQTSRP